MDKTTCLAAFTYDLLGASLHVMCILGVLNKHMAISVQSGVGNRSAEILATVWLLPCQAIALRLTTVNVYDMKLGQDWSHDRWTGTDSMWKQQKA